MKKYCTIVFIILIQLILPRYSQAQSNFGFTVGGDLDKFYPVTFSDPNFWGPDRATEFEIGRQIHDDSQWRGSLIAKFRYHTNGWGAGAHFIDVDMNQGYNGINDNKFIAAWEDITFTNNSNCIVLWLRGGGTTYQFHSASTITVTKYDAPNLLPYQPENHAPITYKTAVEDFAQTYANITARNFYNMSANTHFFNSAIAINTNDAKGYRLAVNGDAIFTRAKVKSFGNWPDYVFKADYELPSLEKLAQIIRESQHLPGIPSAEEIKKEGQDLGEIQRLQMQKIEELTLYILELNKKLENQSRRIEQLEAAKK
ncbi:TMF family protein [Chitinophaga qingshengii]|uniref:TMF family protein n=1 Tax=Chitinophaga qingshengii TaxID=1569794 RepID=A0ABR7TXJ3_9BACT|nr:TMF family protein [Chitinophaga qingshengii]MBC9934435.1 TMF family protein [Chitinophaga qingshengii]